MKILFPRYENEQPHWTNEKYEREVNENECIHSIEEFRQYITNIFGTLTIEICDDIKEQITKAIENNTGINFLTNDLNNFNKSMMKLIISYPIGEIRDYWKEKGEALINDYKTLMKRNQIFIKENKDIIFNMLDENRFKLLDELKSKRQLANKKYYEKQKNKLHITPRILLTSEEKKQKKQLANKQYYETKIKDVIKTERVKLTEEEKRLNRKEANKRYYKKTQLATETY